MFKDEGEMIIRKGTTTTKTGTVSIIFFFYFYKNVRCVLCVLCVLYGRSTQDPFVRLCVCVCPFSKSLFLSLYEISDRRHSRRRCRRCMNYQKNENLISSCYFFFSSKEKQ